MLNIRAFYCVFIGDSEFIRIHFGGLPWYALGAILVECYPLNNFEFECEQTVKDYLSRVVQYLALSKNTLILFVINITNEAQKYIDAHVLDQDYSLSGLRVRFIEGEYVQLFEASGGQGYYMTLSEFYHTNAYLLNFLGKIRSSDFGIKEAEETDRQIYIELENPNEIDAVYEIIFD